MSEAPNPRHTGLKGWRKLRRSMLAILLIAIAAFVPFRLYLSHRVSSELGKIREAGLPTTFEELDTWYEYVPDEENAALLYLAAFDALEEQIDVFPDDELDLLPIFAGEDDPEPWEAYPEATVRAMKDFLEANVQALELVHEASALRGCRYPIDLGNDFFGSIDHYAKIRHVMRLACLDAILAAELTDGDRAVRALCDARALARSLDREPILIPQLVRAACDGMACGAMARVLNRMQLSDGEAEQLIQAYDDSHYSEVLLRTMAGERAYELEVVRWLCSDFLPPAGRDHLTYERLEAAGLGFMCWLSHVAGLMDIKTLRLLHQWDRDIEAIDPSMPEMPGFAVDHAHLLIAGTALAVERHRLAKGRLPANLSDLVPRFLDEMPIDPFNGQPLRFRLLEPGYLIYSVWTNRQDDGGKDGDDWASAFRVNR